MNCLKASTNVNLQPGAGPALHVAPGLGDAARLEFGGYVLHRGVGGGQRDPTLLHPRQARHASRRARHGI